MHKATSIIEIDYLCPSYGQAYLCNNIAMELYIPSLSIALSVFKHRLLHVTNTLNVNSSIVTASTQTATDNPITTPVRVEANIKQDNNFKE